MEKQEARKQDENKRLFGLNIARSLNFTDAQYEEAMRRIDTFDNANQLLVALLDVSATEDSVNAVTTVEHATSSEEVDVLELNCASATTGQQGKAKVRASNSYGTTSSSSSSSSSSTSLYTNAPSGLASSENQSSLECLVVQQQQQVLPNNKQPYNQHQIIQQNFHNYNSLQRQKVQRSRSHQPTTSTCQAPVDLRIIYIDGPNVARTHGKDVAFSWVGIKLCVDWFRRRNHKVKVFVPVDKCDTHGSPTTANIVKYLQQVDALIKTPLGCNDDMFIIEAARQSNGVIVSNDLFRNEKRSNTDLRRFISLSRLPYIFVDDLFIPANDPLGRTGPILDKFLRAENNSAIISQQIHKQSLHRTKSHQRQ